MSDSSDAQRAMYRDRAEAYDALIASEDSDGNLARALAVRLAGAASLADVGAGTGRVTGLVAPFVRRATLFEREPAMLERAKLRLSGRLLEAEYVVADARALPVADACFAAAVAGWVFGHFRHWMPDGWREEVAQALGELERIVVPGGTIIIIETLGTGFETPREPNPLAEYFELVRAHGFDFEWVRTDYVFADAAQAIERMAGFFGPSLVERIEARSSGRVPECTAIFTKVRV